MEKNLSIEPKSEAEILAIEEKNFLSKRLSSFLNNKTTKKVGCLAMWVKDSNNVFFLVTSGHLAKEENNLWEVYDIFNDRFIEIGKTKISYQSEDKTLDYCLISLKEFEYNGKIKTLQPSFTLNLPPDQNEGINVKITNFLKNLKQIPKVKNAIIIAAGSSRKFLKGTFIGKYNNQYLIKPENQITASFTDYGDSGSPIYFHGKNPGENILIGIFIGRIKFNFVNNAVSDWYFIFTPLKYLPNDYVPYTEQTQ